MKEFILRCIEKALSSGFWKDLEGKLQVPKVNERIKVFIYFAEGFSSKRNSLLRGPPGLGYDFYVRGGTFLKNAPFLFGTPSQFRIKSWGVKREGLY